MCGRFRRLKSSTNVLTWIRRFERPSKMKSMKWYNFTSGRFEVTSGKIVEFIDNLNSTECSYRIKWPILNWWYYNLFNKIRKIYISCYNIWCIVWSWYVESLEHLSKMMIGEDRTNRHKCFNKSARVHR